MPMADASASTGSRLHPTDLPTHTASKVVDLDPRRRRRRRRCLCICLLVALSVLILLAVLVLVLFLTVLRVRDPTTRLVSARVAGVVPRLTLPAISLQLNVTLLLTVAVHNPNHASFSYTDGHADLSYRGAQVGDAEIAPGRIPSNGDGTVELALTVQADRIAAHIGELIADVAAGQLALDTAARIPGRVTILGLFKRHAVAYSDCHTEVGVPDFRIRSQECHDQTKL